MQIAILFIISFKINNRVIIAIKIFYIYIHFRNEIQ